MTTMTTPSDLLLKAQQQRRERDELGRRRLEERIEGRQKSLRDAAMQAAKTTLGVDTSRPQWTTALEQDGLPIAVRTVVDGIPIRYHNAGQGRLQLEATCPVHPDEVVPAGDFASLPGLADLVDRVSEDPDALRRGCEACFEEARDREEMAADLDAWRVDETLAIAAPAGEVLDETVAARVASRMGVILVRPVEAWEVESFDGEIPSDVAAALDDPDRIVWGYAIAADRLLPAEGLSLEEQLAQLIGRLVDARLEERIREGNLQAIADELSAGA